MGKIVTIAIHKGGTGKTTVATHLAFLAAERGLNTLIVDTEAQRNATTTVVLPDLDFSKFLRAADLFEDFDVNKPVCQARERLHVLPADDRLLAIERLPDDAAELFRSRLVKLAQGYDLVVIDTAPTMGFGMLAPLIASDFVFSPIVPSRYAVEGIESLILRIEQIQKSINPDLTFLGLLVNRWRKTSPPQNRIVAGLRKDIGEYLFEGTLPESSAIENAANEKRPVWKDAKSGSHRRAAKAVRDVMTYVLDRALPATVARA
jgi:chromosome partitioning protein